MRYAIISDIHGNYEALQAVIDDIDTAVQSDGVPIEAIWCLGDIVGYGPDPSACVRTVRAHCELCVMGNHDAGAAYVVDLVEFSDIARDSLLWTRNELQPDEIAFLSKLPDRTTVPMPEDITLVHGSPVVPLWEYLLTPEAASLSFLSFPTRFCIVGHSHLPTIFLQESVRYTKPKVPVLSARERQVMQYGSEEEGIIASTLEMQAITERPPCFPIRDIPGNWWMPPEDYRAIINPGSVGQPRDGDSRAAYMLYDTDLGFQFRRTKYWVEKTIEKMQSEQFHEMLMDRLLTGY